MLTWHYCKRAATDASCLLLRNGRLEQLRIDRASHRSSCARRAIKNVMLLDRVLEGGAKAVPPTHQDIPCFLLPQEDANATPRATARVGDPNQERLHTLPVATHIGTLEMDEAQPLRDFLEHCFMTGAESLEQSSAC